jgi:hypothetical protein
MWDCFKLVGEKNLLFNEAHNVIQQFFQELGHTTNRNQNYKIS